MEDMIIYPSVFDILQDALCEEDETLDERLALIEDVLCELDEKNNGGEKV